MRRLLLIAIDLSLISLASVVALLLRDNFDFESAHFPGIVVYVMVSVAVSVPILMVLGLDRAVWRFSAMSDYLRVLVAAVLIALGGVGLGFVVNRLEGVARAIPVLQCLLITFFLVGARVIMRLRHAARRNKPLVTVPVVPSAGETVLLLGVNAVAELYIRSVAELASQRIRIAGLIGRSENHRGRLLQQYTVLGGPETIAAIIDEQRVHGVFVDRIVIAEPIGALSQDARTALFELARTSSIRLDFLAERILAPDTPTRPTPSSPQAGGGGAAVTSTKFVVGEAVFPGARRSTYWAVKRGVDIVASATLIVALAPLCVVLALLVIADAGFPAIFWQQRPGRNGRPFRLYKFRTMGDAYDARGQRVPDELRLSPIGAFMRRTRLDELPQLLNILSGDMSFVGPRPLLPVDQSDDAAARLLVRPGLTGWAQVMGGRIIDANDKAALDIWYVCNASIALDCKILAHTVPMITRGERANMAAVEQAWRDLRASGACVDQAVETDGRRVITPLGPAKTTADSRSAAA